MISQPNSALARAERAVLLAKQHLCLTGSIVGSRRKVVRCEGNEHKRGDEGCVCHLIGKTVTIGRRYDSPYVGTVSYHLKGRKQRVRRSEVGAADVMN